MLPGYGRAIASSLFEGPLTGARQDYKTMALSGFKVLVIHVRLNTTSACGCQTNMQGTKDTVVRYEKVVPRLKDILPEADFLEIEGAGHDLLLDDRYWKQAAEKLVAFFKS